MPRNQPLPLSPWTSTTISEAARMMRHAHDFDVASYETSFLAKSLEKRRILTACENSTSYIQLLAQDRNEAEALLRSLAVNYSTFFRNTQTFALLADVILPRLAETKENDGNNGIRIWSAGCAAGQEAWSVAMLLKNLASEREKTIQFQIIATDFSEDALIQARQGIYDIEAVQNIPLKFIQTYFTIKEGTYTITPSLRKQVDFSNYDLLDERSSSPAASIYGDFDLILCSNVLFYYQNDARQRILDKLCSALRPGGFFVTGEAERDMISGRKDLYSVPSPKTIFHKRGIR